MFPDASNMQAHVIRYSTNPTTPISFLLGRAQIAGRSKVVATWQSTWRPMGMQASSTTNVG
jgi:hypothetical protein